MAWTFEWVKKAVGASSILVGRSAVQRLLAFAGVSPYMGSSATGLAVSRVGKSLDLDIGKQLENVLLHLLQCHNDGQEMCKNIELRLVRLSIYGRHGFSVARNLSLSFLYDMAAHYLSFHNEL